MSEASVDALIGAAVAKYRRQRGLEQPDLARALGVSQAQLLN